VKRAGSLRPLAVVVLAWAGASAVLAAGGWATRNYRDFDFFPMWLAGRGVLQGTDIYDPTVWLGLFLQEGSEGYALLPGTGFGYAMPAAILMVPFGLFPLSVAAALWAVTVIALAATGLWALSRVLFRTFGRRDLVALAGLTAASQPIWVTLFTGQPGGILLGIVAHATALLIVGRHLAAGVVLGLLILKPHLFLWAIPVLLIASPSRARLLRGMLLSGGSILIASFLVRPDWPAAWLRTAGRLQGLNVSRANAWGLAPDEARWLGWAVLTLVVAAFALWWRARPPVHVIWAGAVALSLFGAPYSWSYDQGILAVPAAVIIAAVAARPPALRVPVLAALAAGWVVLPWLLYLDAHRTGAEPAAAVVPVAVLTLLIGAYPGARSSSRREDGSASLLRAGR